jgi:hypothetical protein
MPVGNAQSINSEKSIILAKTFFFTCVKAKRKQKNGISLETIVMVSAIDELSITFAAGSSNIPLKNNLIKLKSFKYNRIINDINDIVSRVKIRIFLFIILGS